MNQRQDYQKALQLRLSGKTYGEIKTAFGIPKSTLSTWFAKLKVDKKAQKILQSKTKNSYLKLIEFNKARTSKIRQENETIRLKHESLIGKLSDRELMLLGAALYWGEGHKNFSESRRCYPYISFSNSDPLMIRVFLDFVENFLKISKNGIFPNINIYPSGDSVKAIKYWHKVTGINSSKFRCYKVLSRASNNKRPKNLLPHGTLQLRIHKRQEFFKVKGLIDGIIKSIYN